jgi:hypothetical protein
VERTAKERAAIRRFMTTFKQITAVGYPDWLVYRYFS